MAEPQHEKNTISSDIGSDAGSDTSDIMIVDAHRDANAQELPEERGSPRSATNLDAVHIDQSAQAYSDRSTHEYDCEQQDEVEGQRHTRISSDAYSRESSPQQSNTAYSRAPEEGRFTIQQPGAHAAVVPSVFTDDQSVASQYQGDDQFVEYGHDASAPAHHADARIFTDRPQSRPSNAMTARATIDDDTGNLLKIVAHKFQQREANLNAGFATEREALQYELSHVHDSNKRLENQVKHYHAKCEKMSAEIHNYKTNYTARLAKFSKFMGGLGNDLASLRREGDAAKERSDDTRREIDHMKERLSIMSEREQNLLTTKATYKRLLDTKSCDLQLVIEHRDSLKSQLDDRVGQLAEERDRSLALRQRIRELEAGERSSFGKQLDQIKESVLGRLGHIAKSDDNLLLSIDGIRIAIQGMGTKKLAGVADCDEIKKAVAQLSGSVIQCETTLNELGRNSAKSPDKTANEAVQDAVRELHNEFNSWKNTMEQHCSDREEQAELSAQLQGSLKHAQELETQLFAAQASEASLNAAVSTLTAQVKELEASCGSESASPCRSQAAIDRLVKDAEAKAQRQMAENAKAFKAEQQAAFENQLKKTVNERDRTVQQFQEKIGQLRELHDAELEQSRSKYSSASIEAQRQLNEMRALLQRNDEELEAAKASAAQRAVMDTKFTALTAEVEATKTELASVRESHQSLVRENDETKLSATRSRSSEDQAHALLEKLRLESEVAIADVKRQLSHAEDHAKRAEAGSAQMKISGERAVLEAKEKNRKQLEALQERLAEVEAEVQVKNGEMETFRQTVEESWGREQSTWQDKVESLERVVATERTSREESTKLIAQLQRERDACSAELARLHALEQQVKPALDSNKASATPSGASNTVGAAAKPNEDITPTDVLEPTAPPKLRKRVDRSTNRVVEALPVPSPEAIRPRPKSTTPDQRGPQGPIVQDSQNAADLVMKRLAQQESSSSMAPDFRTASFNSDEMLDNALSQNLHETVPETQFDEFPTTFAEINHNLASSALQKAAQSTAHVHASQAHQIRGMFDAAPVESHTVTELQPAHPAQEPSFQIFEDSPRPHQKSQNNEGEYEDDAYTFRMPTVKPNSASKRLPRSNSQTSNAGGTARTSYSRYRTPETREKTPKHTRGSAQAASRPSSSNHSSTPPFLRAADSHKINKYQSSGSSVRAKRRVSRTSSYQTVDPRITAKAVAQKRAAERESQQEYQPAPKRRIVTGIEAGSQRESTNEQSFARSSQSVNDLPRITEPVRRTNSSSRMRTLGGSSSRTAGRSKVSKNDEYGARFSQELGRR